LEIRPDVSGRYEAQAEDAPWPEKGFIHPVDEWLVISFLELLQFLDQLPQVRTSVIGLRFGGETARLQVLQGQVQHRQQDEFLSHLRVLMCMSP
jgi:hypothetical protein